MSGRPTNVAGENLVPFCFFYKLDLHFVIHWYWCNVIFIFIYLLHIFLSSFQELELCILNVSIECLDIQQVLQLSRQNSMHSALISVWNRALMDYTSPLQELLPKLRVALDTGERISLKRTLLSDKVRFSIILVFGCNTNQILFFLIKK